MVFREVTVVQIKEALRRWLKGEGERPIAQGVGVDRKTARRYIAAALELGIDRSGGEGQLTDELIGQVAEKVRPHRPDGHGEAWRRLLAEEEHIKAWVKEDLTVVKIGILLQRRGVVVPHRTLARFAVERCGAGRKRSTVRVDDPPPGIELQVDFGRLGLVPDGERRRVCHGLIFTAVFSRHQFVWPTFTQTTEDVISGFEAAWRFFGGVFPVVIPDNMASIVTKAENTAPRFNDTFFEYAQSRGFVIDAARVATPTDKPRVERVVSYVQKNFFAGESFIDLADCRERAEIWCKKTAGMRIHGTTQCRPAEVFRLEELARFGQLPGAAVRHPALVRAEAAPRLPRGGGQGPLFRPAPARRQAPQGKARLKDREALLPRRAREAPSEKAARRALDRSGGHAEREGDLRDKRPRPPRPHGRRPRGGDRRLCEGDLGHPASLDQDAPGLSPLGAGEEVGPGPGRVGLSACPRGRGDRREPHQPHAGTRQGGDRARRPARAGLGAGTLCP